METFRNHGASMKNAKCVTGVLVSVFSCVLSVFSCVLSVFLPIGLWRPVGSDTHQHTSTQSHPRLISRATPYKEQQ